MWYARKVNRSVRTPAIGSSGWAGVEEVAGCNVLYMEAGVFVDVELKFLWVGNGCTGSRTDGTLHIFNGFVEEVPSGSRAGRGM